MITLSINTKESKTTISLLGNTFHYIQELEPERDQTGEIKVFHPHLNYKGKDSVPLNKFGLGPFCSFSLHSKGYWGASGVYAIFDNKSLLYIGKTVNLERQFNNGFGTIQPINCYVGGQSTNCKINSMILAKYIAGNNIHLYFLETKENDRVKRHLVSELKPCRNIQ